MSSSDLLSNSLTWPGKGGYGLKSSGKKIILHYLLFIFPIIFMSFFLNFYLVLQTTENNLIKQVIVSDHMRNHYRRLHGAKCINLNLFYFSYQSIFFFFYSCRRFKTTEIYDIRSKMSRSSSKGNGSNGIWTNYT